MIFSCCIRKRRQRRIVEISGPITPRSRPRSYTTADAQKQTLRERDDIFMHRVSIRVPRVHVMPNVKRPSEMKLQGTPPPSMATNEWAKAWETAAGTKPEPESEPESKPKSKPSPKSRWSESSSTTSSNVASTLLPDKPSRMSRLSSYARRKKASLGRFKSFRSFTRSRSILRSSRKTASMIVEPGEVVDRRHTRSSLFGVPAVPPIPDFFVNAPLFPKPPERVFSRRLLGRRAVSETGQRKVIPDRLKMRRARSYGIAL